MKKKVFILSLFAVGMLLFMLMKGVKDTHSSSPVEKAVANKGDRLMIAHTEIFGTLERPAVLFDHGLHEKSLKKEGCKTCHPAVTDGDLLFKYPFSLIIENKNTVKDAYHEKCISCHTKLIEQGKKYGPVTCGECHDRKRAAVKVAYPVSDFDFALHEKHVSRLKGKCDYCHHSYDREDNELVYEQGTEQSCSYCHDLQARRGPLLSAETAVTRGKGLSLQRVSHDRCVNCHLFYALKQEKTGHLECRQCHSGTYKTLAQLEKVPRPERDQPKKTHISIEDAKMKEVFFDHEYHEKNARTCRGCHHETLRACKECHTLAGRDEGGRVTIADAYHDLSSQYSCAGCHGRKKTARECSGCHYRLVDVDILAGQQKKELCLVCHRGKRGSLPGTRFISPASLNTEKVPDKVTIKILEKLYEPSEFPHRKIVAKLIAISNEDKMATAFHREMQTICNGCHHRSSEEAEGQKGKPPYCRSCHSFFFDAKNLNKPRLLAAYHRQCIGCHEQMEIRQQGCPDCHKEKAGRPKDIL